MEPISTGPLVDASCVTEFSAAFVADPFLIRKDDRWYIFFEAWNNRYQKGEICYAFSENLQDWQYGQSIISQHYHLSYPCIFKWRGKEYLVPESRKAGFVGIYECRKFPDKWLFRKVLIEGDFADPTVFRHAKNWYMFLLSGKKTLVLYSASSLFGPWVQHPKSPLIKQSPSNTRPGGRVVSHGNDIYRICQDGDQIYGHRVFAYQIKKLSLSEYEEHKLIENEILGPGNDSWNRLAMHHVDAKRMKNGTWVACVDGASRFL